MSLAEDSLLRINLKAFTVLIDWTFSIISSSFKCSTWAFKTEKHTMVEYETKDNIQFWTKLVATPLFQQYYNLIVKYSSKAAYPLIFVSEYYHFYHVLLVYQRVIYTDIVLLRRYWVNSLKHSQCEHLARVLEIKSIICSWICMYRTRKLNTFFLLSVVFLTFQKLSIFVFDIKTFTSKNLIL